MNRHRRRTSKRILMMSGMSENNPPFFSSSSSSYPEDLDEFFVVVGHDPAFGRLLRVDVHDGVDVLDGAKSFSPELKMGRHLYSSGREAARTQRERERDRHGSQQYRVLG